MSSNSGMEDTCSEAETVACREAALKRMLGDLSQAGPAYPQEAG